MRKPDWYDNMLKRIILVFEYDAVGRLHRRYFDPLEFGMNKDIMSKTICEWRNEIRNSW